MTVVFLVALVALTSPLLVFTADRARDRRIRRVIRDPGLANLGDIARLLDRSGVPHDKARRVLDRAGELGVSPQTMWVWSRRFGADGLATAITAGLGHGELLGHLIDGTSPDFRDLRVLADLRF